MIDSFPCPRCGRRLERSGEITDGGTPCPVFQCDECLVETEMFGEVAFTFAVDAGGRPFDPAASDDDIDFGTSE